jgi:DNA-binding cell septation regulator SpoVG
MNSVVVTRIKKVDFEGIKAFADIVVNGVIVRGMKLLVSKNNPGEMYAGFPSEKGKDDKYHTIVYVEDVNLKQEIFNTILVAYEKE